MTAKEKLIERVANLSEAEADETLADELGDVDGAAIDANPCANDSAVVRSLESKWS